MTLVLGGGGARGFAHIGVLKALEQEKIPITQIIGVSSGSLFGGLYASQPNVQWLEKLAMSATKKDAIDFDFKYFWQGPFSGKALVNFIQKNLKQTQFSQLIIPFQCTAVDIATGEEIILNTGDVATSIQASCALPPFFRPIQYKDRTLVDGGIVNPLPCYLSSAENNITVGIDVSSNLSALPKPKNNALTTFWRSYAIAINSLSKLGGKNADLLITPDVGTTSVFDDSQKSQTIQAGYDAMIAKTNTLRELIHA